MNTQEIIKRANKKARSKQNINWIFMYDFRGKLVNKFKDLNDASKKLNKHYSVISSYIKKENRFDGIHFLCRKKINNKKNEE